MKRIAFAIAAFTLGTFALAQQPPGDKGGKGGDKGDKGRNMRANMVGKVIPPFMLEQLKLTDEQKKAVEDLEKDVKAKLDKILTDDQKKILENPVRPEGRPEGRPGGDRGPEGKGKGDKGGARPEGEKKPVEKP